MDDGDRTAPVALAGDAPIAQPVLHLPLADGAAVSELALEPPRHFLFRFGHPHAVEKTRVDQEPIAFVGSIGDPEGGRVLAVRANHRDDRQPVFVDEIQVALVVRGAAEDRAGAVVHQDEIGDVERQLDR